MLSPAGLFFWRRKLTVVLKNGMVIHSLLPNPNHHFFPKATIPFLFTAPVSNLRVVWRKDHKIDDVIERDKQYKLCSRVVKEVLNEPGQAIPLHYLEKRRKRMRLNIRIMTFLAHYPGLFDVYKSRFKPKSDLVSFIRPSDKLRRFLEEEKLIRDGHEELVVSKLCKLLMMTKDKAMSSSKLDHLKREFGFPNDFLVNLIPKYPEYFRLVGSPGEGESALELVSWNPKFAKSVIELRAEEEERLTGIRVRPSFSVKLPDGFFLKKEMREWVRDWMDLPYISPYADASSLNQDSCELEKRTVGVLHELLSLSLFKRIAVPIIGKLCADYRLPNAFSNIFTRHSGIFYMSLKGGIKTAVLREAYKENELVDRDPLLTIKDKFSQLLEEGKRQRRERQRLKREVAQEKLHAAVIKNVKMNDRGNYEGRFDDSEDDMFRKQENNATVDVENHQLDDTANSAGFKKRRRRWVSYKSKER